MRTDDYKQQYTQANYEPATNDSLSVCLAYVLELPAHSVPNFASYGIMGRHTPEAERYFNTLLGSFEAWLAEAKPELTFHHTMCESAKLQHVPDGECILFGYNEIRHSHHAVVGHAEGGLLTLEHDPHPNSTGLTMVSLAMWLTPNEQRNATP